MTTAFQTVGTIFIPKNSWAEWKIMTCGFWCEVATNVPNQIGGPDYQEAYVNNGAAAVVRLVPFTVPVAPSRYRAWLQRSFIFDGVTVFELNMTGDPPLNSISHTDGTDHIIPAIPGFVNTIDNTLEIQIKTSFAGSTDTVNVLTGQAFIQSPLDLGRLPR